MQYEFVGCTPTLYATYRGVLVAPLATVLSNLVDERIDVGMSVAFTLRGIMGVLNRLDLRGVVGDRVVRLADLPSRFVCLLVAKTFSFVCPLHGRRLRVNCWKTQLTTDRVTWTLGLLATLDGLKCTPMNPDMHVLSGILHRRVTETVTENVLTILVSADFRPLSPRKILLRLLLGHEFVATQFLVLFMSNETARSGCIPGKCPWIGWRLIMILVGVRPPLVPLLERGRFIP